MIGMSNICLVSSKSGEAKQLMCFVSLWKFSLTFFSFFFFLFFLRCMIADVFCKIQYNGYRAMMKAATNAMQKKKLKKLQYSGEKAFKTITVDAVHLYLTEPKTIFTEFLWHMVVCGSALGMKEDVEQDWKQEEEMVRLQEQVQSNVFTVEGEGIEAQELTFGSFCQAVVRISMVSLCG